MIKKVWKFVKSRFYACETKESLFVRMYNFLTFDMGSEGSRCHCCIFWRGGALALALASMPVSALVTVGWQTALGVALLEAFTLLAFMKVSEV